MAAVVRASTMTVVTSKLHPGLRVTNSTCLKVLEEHKVRQAPAAPVIRMTAFAYG
jgi:hypothetical protein